MSDIIIEGVQTASDETDQLHELVSRVELSEERARAESAAILERVETCQQTVSNLSQAMQTENPLWSQISHQLAEIQVELKTLRLSILDLEASTSNHQPSTSTVVIEETPELLVSTEEPAQDAQHVEEPPVLHRRVNRL